MATTDSRSTTALVLMDFQTNIMRRYREAEIIIPHLISVLSAARQASMPVIYVVVGFRKGLPEISQGNKSFSQIKQNQARSMDLEEPVEVHSAIAPLAGDILITKRRVSAFTGSDLEVVLRSQEIDHLVLCGIATSGVVLSTLREAADKDYGLTVLADCCFDADEEVHDVLIKKIFPRQADVTTSTQWAAALDKVTRP